MAYDVDFNTAVIPRWEAARAADTGSRDFTTIVSKLIAADRTTVAGISMLAHLLRDVNTLEFYVSSSPALLTSLSYWLVPSPNTMFTDTTATTKVSNSGQSVKCWTDIKNGFKATEATNPPVWLDNQVNGYPAMRFNGTSSILAVETAGLGIAQNVTGMTAFAAFIPRRVAGVTIEAIYGVSTNAVATRFTAEIGRIASKSMAMSLRALDADTAAVPNSVADKVVKDVACVGTWRENYTGSLGQCWVDGVSAFAEVSTAPGVTAGNTSNTASAAIKIGANVAGAAFAQMDLMELIVFNTALSTANRQSVEDYLSRKYAIRQP